jgi:hypothetical protein
VNSIKGDSILHHSVNQGKGTIFFSKSKIILHVRHAGQNNFEQYSTYGKWRLLQALKLMPSTRTLHINTKLVI